MSDTNNSMGEVQICLGYQQREGCRLVRRTDITEILGDLLSRINRMLKDKRICFDDMMNTALAYMIHGWKGLLNYHLNGRYDIDNTEAERKI